jgi:hypothetical protein
MSRLNVTVGSLQEATMVARDEAERKALQREAEEADHYRLCITFHIRQINSVLAKVADLSSKGAVVDRNYDIDSIRESGGFTYGGREGEALGLMAVRTEVIRVLHEQGLSAIWLEDPDPRWRGGDEVGCIKISWKEGVENE